MKKISYFRYIEENQTKQLYFSSPATNIFLQYLSLALALVFYSIKYQQTFCNEHNMHWGSCLFQKSAYLTEVHHINGDGEDAGIVYCEMQARENTGSSRTQLELTRSMYPGHCGYKVL